MAENIIRYRKYLDLPISTEPLIRGCLFTKRNLAIFDYCDEHGLDREKATYIDNEGNLHLKVQK